MNEINISKILSSYPIGTQLYSPAYGNCLYQGLEANGAIRLKKFLDGNLVMIPGNGIIADGGELMLYPSRNMRDWRKFAWKKGDVLRYSDILVMFGGWANGDYTQFKAAFECKCGSNLFVGGIIYYTSDFCKATDDVANNFIMKLEDYYNGKLNLETLEIEKPQFKDGDIFLMSDGWNEYIGIFKNMSSENRIATYAHCFKSSKNITIGLWVCKIPSDDLRLATEEEKQQLFAALEKDGKAWDAEKKKIVDLPKKCEFKPFDKVLVRDEYDEEWFATIFSHYRSSGAFKYHCINSKFKQCIPYNEQTAHLLGTTDDWKGDNNV